MPPGSVATVVSRGGRPDLAMPQLPGVHCPVLLIVGGDDDQVIALHRKLDRQLIPLFVLLLTVMHPAARRLCWSLTARRWSDDSF